MNPNFNRRQFIGLAVCVAVNTALPGCKKKEPEWTAAKDDKLKPLAFEISEGKATPLPDPAGNDATITFISSFPAAPSRIARLRK